MAVPSIFVFHNGRPLFKYNYTEYSLPSFTQTFSLLTGLEPENVTEKRLEILQEDETTWRSATVCGYGYDTSIRIKYDGQDEENMVDLAKEQYRWII